MKKILCIFGTRPEAIKMAPVILRLKSHASNLKTLVLNTAQHREMLDQVLTLFELVPDYDLALMRPNQGLAQLSAHSLEGIDQILQDEKPDMVIVQGDTTTTLCGALASFYRKIKLGHVEAGLRTECKYAPFPEEINRRMVTQLSDFHFAPTENARRALLAERVKESAIHVTGNTGIDALLFMRDRNERIPPQVDRRVVEDVNAYPAVLVTGHRRESFGRGFDNICRAIRYVADTQKNVVFVYPVHLNPNVLLPVNEILGNHSRIHLIKPMPYESFVWLMQKATLILTDSGGVQEEAPSLGKPVLVMRDTTERPEGIVAGNARLVGTNEEDISRHLLELLNDSDAREKMAQVNNPYGDGRAAQRIVEILVRELA